MLNQNLGIIGATLKILSGFCFLSAALCTFFAVLQNDKHESTKQWFSQKWQIISQNPFHQLPERAISSIIIAKNKFSNFIIRIGDLEEIHVFLMIFVIIMFNLAVLIYYRPIAVIYSLFLSVPAILPILHHFFNNHKAFIEKLMKALTIISTPSLLFFNLGCPMVGAGILWTLIALKTSLFLSFLSMLIALPCFYLLLLAPAYLIVNRFNIEKITQNDVSFVGTSVGLSFAITFLALLLGNSISCGSYVPQTFQILISNVIFDGVTMIFTLILLEWALKKRSLVRIPIAIIFDIVIAAILACASLYLGLLKTDHHLSIIKVILILFGRSSTQIGYEFGPFFWAMHTAFLPTIFYLSIT